MCVSPWILSIAGHKVFDNMKVINYKQSCKVLNNNDNNKLNQMIYLFYSSIFSKDIIDFIYNCNVNLQYV